MPLIRSVSSTRDRLGFGVDADRDAAIESHLDIAVETISDRIRTEITRVDVIDTFFVRFTLRSPLGTGGRKRPATSRNTGIAIAGASTTVFLLSRGFVAAAPAVTIFAAGTEEALDDTAQRTDLTSVVSIDHTLIEMERGVLRVQDFGLDGVYVRVSYRAGFLDDGASPLVFTGTPEWLVRAGDLETRILVNSDAIFGRDDIVGARGQNEQDRLESRLSNILLKHARYIPTAEKPIHSSATPSSV